MTHCLFVERLTNIDFTYFDLQRGLVGETLWVDVRLYGQLNDDQMIWDFTEVKQQLKHAIEAYIDHKLLLPARAKGVQIDSNTDRTLECHLQDTKNRLYRYQAPSISVCILDAPEITLPHLQQSLSQYLQQHPTLAARLTPLKCELKLYADANTQDSNSEPYFQYSHGLKQHRGPCQRIVHGHRSQLRIYLNQQRAPSLERFWVKQWQDIYLGCEQDFQRTFKETNIQYDEFAYHCAEGFYQIQLPTDGVYRLPESSTIECIAAYLANKLHADYPTQHLQVQIYEGVLKGAIHNCEPLSN